MVKKTAQATMENLDEPTKKATKTKTNSSQGSVASTNKKNTSVDGKTVKKTTHQSQKEVAGQEIASPAAKTPKTIDKSQTSPAKVNSSKTLYLIVLAVCIMGVCLLAWRHWAPTPPTTVDEPVANVSQDQPQVFAIPAGTYIATTMTDDQGEIDVGTLFAILGVTNASETRIALNIDGQGHATMTVFGEQDTFSYDEAYFYTSDGAVVSYNWDGQKLTIKEESTSTVFVPEADYVPPQLDDETLQAVEEFMQSLESSVQL